MLLKLTLIAVLATALAFSAAAALAVAAVLAAWALARRLALAWSGQSRKPELFVWSRPETRRAVLRLEGRAP